MKGILLILLLLAGQASANSYFKVVDVSPIIVTPGSESNFTVTIRSAGGSGAFAEPIFNFNTTKGLSAEVPGGLRYIVATGGRTYNCTMKAGNITPGNYSFRVGVYAQDAPFNWRTAFVTIEGLKKAINTSLNESFKKSGMLKTNGTGSSGNKSGPEKTTAPGILFAIAAVILASRKARS